MGEAGQAAGDHFMCGPATLNASIIIASHRARSIGKCLEDLLNKNTQGASFEIIVVADYQIEQFAESYPEVHWKYHADKNIPAKRNIGIAAAQSPIVGFIDDDCVPFDNWVDSAMRYFRENPESAGVFGRTIVEQSRGISFPLKEFKRLEMPSFRTNNIFYKKDFVLKAGGFDERFSVQREDMDLAFSMLRRGFSIGYCAEMKVLHCIRQNERWDLLKNCLNRRFDPLLFKKHGSLYRKWIKTPFTPSIGLVTVMHGAVALGFWCGSMIFEMTVLADAIAVLIVGVKRAMHGKIDTTQIVRDVASYCIAPFVITGALLHGSIKFKKFLFL
jgi:glycosyltransferase involved in cell wall biosynthesis